MHDCTGEVNLDYKRWDEQLVQDIANSKLKELAQEVIGKAVVRVDR
ncbi:hypothetical protein [Allocoleopsis sp.]